MATTTGNIFVLKTKTRCVLKPARKVKLVIEVAHLRTITSMDRNQISKLIAYSNGVYHVVANEKYIHSAGAIKDSWSGQALVMRADSSLSLQSSGYMEHLIYYHLLSV